MLRTILLLFSILVVIQMATLATGSSVNRNNTSEYSFEVDTPVSWSGEYGIIGGDMHQISSESNKNDFIIGALPTGKTLKISIKKEADFANSAFVLFPPEQAMNVTVYKGNTSIQRSTAGDYSSTVLLYVNT